MLHLHLSNSSFLGFLIFFYNKSSFEHQRFKCQRRLKVKFKVILLFHKIRYFIHFARESEPHLPYLCDLLCDVLRAVLYIGGTEQLHPGSGR